MECKDKSRNYKHKTSGIISWDAWPSNWESITKLRNITNELGRITLCIDISGIIRWDAWPSNWESITKLRNITNKLGTITLCIDI